MNGENRCEEKLAKIRRDLARFCACVELEEIGNWDAQLHCEYLEVFEGGSIDAALDQAQKVYRNVEQLGELLLAHPPGQANRLEAIPKFFAKTRQLVHRFGGESRLGVFSLPPNEITGKDSWEPRTALAGSSSKGCVGSVLGRNFFVNLSVTARLPGVSVSKGSEPVSVREKQLTIEGEVPDELLMARVCDGDKEALASLFCRYARTVRGVAYRVLRDASEADDLLQDVFLLIHRLCRTFDSSKGSARFWILQMTHRRAISRRRYLTSRHFYSRLGLDENAAPLAVSSTRTSRHRDSICDGLEKRETLQGWFEKLSPNQRETLQLFFFEGCTFEEIAVRLGQTTVNVRHHYYRGLERLRKQIFAGKLSSDGAL